MKILAMTAMVWDHIAVGINAHFPNAYEMILRMPGRISIPIFCFMLAYNFVHHSRHQGQYTLRILALAIISEPIYEVYFRENANAFVPLFLGVAAIYILSRSHWKWESRYIAMLFWAIILFAVFWWSEIVEVPACAVLVITCWLGVTRGWRLYAPISLAIAVLLNEVVWECLIMIPITALIIFAFMKIEPWAKIRMNKWIGYWFYPTHITILFSIFGAS